MQELFAKSFAPSISAEMWPVLWLSVDTRKAVANLVLRAHVGRLVHGGVNQKAVAVSMGMTQGPFSRWLNGETKRPLGVDAAAGYRQFLSALIALATQDVNAIPSKEEQARLEAELEATKAERRLSRRAKSRKSGKTLKKGKGLAKA